MKTLRIAIALILILMLPAMALAEADAARHEELLTANSVAAWLERHGTVRALREVSFEDKVLETQKAIMDTTNYYTVYADGYAYLAQDYLSIHTNYDDHSMIVETLYDSDDSYAENFYGSYSLWEQYADKETLLETEEADGAFIARTELKDADAVKSTVDFFNGFYSGYAYEEGMTLAFTRSFDAKTGDLTKVEATLVDAEGNAHSFYTDEYTFDVDAFDPAAADSPFYSYFAAEKGFLNITARFLDTGTEMAYYIPHGAGINFWHNDDYADAFLDEACTQPFESGVGIDELTLYVK